MLVSLNWLSEFCELPSKDQLISDFNRIGFEVESATSMGTELSHIVVGQITEFKKHPDADRLRIAQVDIGKSTVQIVTAAQNVATGDKVPVSLPGAKLANGLTIKKGKLRGIESNGMMCSAVECGLTDTSPGVWVLPSTTNIGDDFIVAAQLIDTILDLAILPNRGDALSLTGLARECIALYGQSNKLKTHTPKSKNLSKSKLTCVADTKFCHVYRAQQISGINNKQTPLHFQTKLYYSGFRPISWIVDVTNIVMIETGQPLHAFDAKGVHHIEATFAKNDSVELLNEKTYSLSDSIPIIKVNQTIGAVAGIMGASHSDIQEETTDIILETAIFDSIITRKATKSLGLRSESSNRFEKHVDSALLLNAVGRVHDLLSQYDDITIYEPQLFGDLSKKVSAIDLNLDRLNQFLGTSFSLNDINKRLIPLGFKLEGNQIVIPSWRREDCKEWPDIAEELCRFSGIEEIPPTPLKYQGAIAHNVSWLKRQEFQNIAIQLGLTEVIPFPLCQQDIEDKQPRILNPITPELTQLRSNAVSSLVSIAAFNAARHQTDCRLFSIGPVWKASRNESTHLAVLIQGTGHYQPHNPSHHKSVDFYELKGILDQLLKGQSYALERSKFKLCHPGQSADILIDGVNVGVIGMLHPNIEASHRITKTGIIEIDLAVTIKETGQLPTYNLVSKFPATSRDVTYIMDKEKGTVGDVLTILKANKPSSCESIELCGYFSKDGSKDVNISFRMIYQNNARSLEMAEVNEIHKQFAEEVINKLPCRFP